MKKIITLLMLLSTGKVSLGQTNIFPANGNVGIGNTYPASLLHIGSGTGSLHIAQPGILIKNGAGDRSLMEIHSPGGENRFILQSLKYGFYLAGLDEKPLLIQTSGGKVNIGTENSDPNALLTVKGGIAATEIKVATTSGADFVFSENYKLPSLKEIETFITKNNHLPAIPSAENMVKNGLELGQMNILLLQKIEELTLHLIKKEKEIEELKDEVKQIKAKL